MLLEELSICLLHDSSKVPLWQYLIYGTDYSASMIYWHWWSCNN